jgi:hypothetical protein
MVDEERNMLADMDGLVGGLRNEAKMEELE